MPFYCMNIQFDEKVRSGRTLKKPAPQGRLDKALAVLQSEILDELVGVGQATVAVERPEMQPGDTVGLGPGGERIDVSQREGSGGGTGLR